MIAAGAGLLLWSQWHGGSAAQQAAAGTGAAGAAGSAQRSSAVTTPVPASPADAGGPIVPRGLAIPAIGVDTTVESRGTQRYTNPFTGEAVSGYGVPASMRTVSWWSDGPEPGSGRMAVILGHTQVGGYGVFNKLTRLRAGDDVTLTASNGSVQHLRVLGSPVTGLDKSTSALADALNGHPAGADVALVTCGGSFDESAHQSEDNDVVFAGIVH